jgi:hypothetical protein
VPERLFVSSGGADGKQSAGNGMLGLLIDLLVAEKSGWQPIDGAESGDLKTLAENMTSETIESLQTQPVAKS